MTTTNLALPMQQVSSDVTFEKYAKNLEKKSKSGLIAVDSIRKRVAKALAKPEKRKDYWTERFYFAMLNGFIPAGRINSAAGTDINATLVNCFVQPISDCISNSSSTEPGIFNALTDSAETQRRGGGVGYNFSSLRPKHALVKGTQSASSGPVSYMRVFDRMCETVESAGSRRGAQMGVLNVDHPDIFEFISAKRDGSLSNFNISVGVSDEFMQILLADGDIELWHVSEPTKKYIEEHKSYEKAGGWVYRVVKASEIWDLVMRNTYEGAEPGVLYLGAINSKNNLSYCERIVATNPCGEQPLPPFGACVLGSLNLSAFVRNPFSEISYFDYDLFNEVVKISARALDNVISISQFPLEQQKAEAEAKRRVGLGFTGLGSALVMLGIKYNSDEGYAFASNVSMQLAHMSYESSIETAQEKGCFPLFDADKYLAAPHFASTLPESIQADIRKYGIRNSHLTSIAPTGTISLAFADNVSNGIEPAFSWTYERAKREADNTRSIYVVKDHAFRVYEHMGLDVNALPEQFVSALEMSATDHLKMVQAVAPYIDSAISKTVNVPEDYPFDDFKNLYLDAWKAGLKGITTFRPNNFTGSVLSVPTSQPTQTLEVEPRVTFNNVPTPALKSLKWRKRPELEDGNPSWTYLSSGPGFSFSTVIGHIDNDLSPFEAWVNGAEAPRGLGALAKSLSMDMRCTDRKFLQTKLIAISQTQGYTAFEHKLPGGKVGTYTNPVALFADLVLDRCEKLQAFADLSYTPSMDSMLSQKESLTTSSGAMGWYVDIRNPITNDQFVMMLKEGHLPDGTRVPYGVSLSEGFPPSLLGLAKSLSMDMQVADPAWIGGKLRQLQDFVEPQGEFYAAIPGTTKQKHYNSTVAYMVALMIHRYAELGILDQEGYPVKQSGALDVVDSANPNKTFVAPKGLPCPSCKHPSSLTKVSGCGSCLECGFSNCG